VPENISGETDLFWRGTLELLTESVRGLSCRSQGSRFVSTGNQSLGFIALDSKTHLEFAERLGIVDTRALSPTAANFSTALILDKKAENLYVLNEPITPRSLSAFIRDFALGRLTSAGQRFLRSELRQDSYSNPQDNIEAGMPAFSSATPAATAGGGHSFSQWSGGHRGVVIRLRKVTTNSFRHIVMDQDKDVILLYYAPWCGPCKSVYPTFLSLAHYFRGAPNLVFAHLDASTNDLPWEFSVSRYPQVIFFPRQRKSESSAFPTHLPLTLPNLIAFVLASADATLRASFALLACSWRCRERNRRAAILKLQSLRGQLRHMNRRLALAEQQLAYHARAADRSAPNEKNGASDSIRNRPDSSGRDGGGSASQEESTSIGREEGEGDLLPDDRYPGRERRTTASFLRAYIGRTLELRRQKRLERRGLRALILMLTRRNDWLMLGAEAMSLKTAELFNERAQRYGKGKLWAEVNKLLEWNS
jgi:thiol-disulfide isomerase/thioredoxin